MERFRQSIGVIGNDNNNNTKNEAADEPKTVINKGTPS